MMRRIGGSGTEEQKRGISRAASAFTLVELLTVIGIIAVLAAILFPVFATVRGKARQATCASNLRQIGMAMQMYVQDADGLLPYGKDASDYTVPQIWDASGCKDKILAMPVLHWHREPLGSNNWVPGILDSYIKNRAVWGCPSDTGFDFLDNNDSCNGPCAMPSRPSMFEAHGASYLFRTGDALAQTNLDNMKGRRPDGSEASPGNINLLFDGNGSWHGSPVSLGRNGLRYVTLFVDGHVKLLSNTDYQLAWQTSLLPPGANPCP